jgi:hypothetical protein
MHGKNTLEDVWWCLGFGPEDQLFVILQLLYSSTNPCLLYGYYIALHSSLQLHSHAQIVVVDCGVNDGTFWSLFSDGLALLVLWLDP